MCVFVFVYIQYQAVTLLQYLRVFAEEILEMQQDVLDGPIFRAKRHTPHLKSSALPPPAPPSPTPTPTPASPAPIPRAPSPVTPFPCCARTSVAFVQ